MKFNAWLLFLERCLLSDNWLSILTKNYCKSKQKNLVGEVSVSHQKEQNSLFLHDLRRIIRDKEGIGALNLSKQTPKIDFILIILNIGHMGI